jgi:hypothetical protein
MPERDCTFQPRASDYWQLQHHDPDGGDNCTAWAGALAAAYDSCGAIRLTGTQIRAASSEPEPDPLSPGLNLPQVRAAISGLTDGRVLLGVNVGSEPLSWEEYESRRKAGHGLIAQIDYTPIRESMFRADMTFGGGHAIFETSESTYDTLADGRRAGIWLHDGRVYPRSLIKEAAGELVLGKSGTKAGFGKVWCALTGDRRAEGLTITYGRNEMISASGYNLKSDWVMDLKQGEPLRFSNSPTATIATRMSASKAVACFGNAGNGMRAVLVSTAAGYDDGVKRPSLLYVRAAASPIKPK